MGDALVAAAIGLASGVLSGLFGVGGGIVTTPAIRLLMGAPSLVAVATPLPVILTGALTGAMSFIRRGDADFRAGITLGACGAITAVAGAWMTRVVGGSVVLLGTAVIIIWAAVDMALQAWRPPRVVPDEPAAPTGRRMLALVGVGLATGAYSGFFGLGGGMVLVPMLTRWLHYPLKRAIGTSLVTMTLLAVPGTVTHAVLGHVDWAIAAGLVVGVVPGAMIGARLNAGAADRTLRVGFALLLVGAAAWLGASEWAALS